ncbi:MAG: lipoprotein-releasing ABC transporter permease subunit LolE [Arsenophonus sp.]|nr:MAG: lipoprotein-releasing ABC transporter permease subunit LolE [Arsenophonus sp.]
MQLLYSLYIAIHYIKSKRKSKLVYLIFIISILGIIFGVSILIVSLSAINGFEFELKNRILSVVPHGQIISFHEPYLNWKKDFKKIINSPGILAVSPYIDFNGLIQNKKKLKTIKIIGVDLSSEHSVSSLPKYVLNNAWNQMKSKNFHIILGEGIAKILKVSVGDKIIIIIPNSKLGIHKPYKIFVNIVGLLKLNGMLDYQIGIVPLEDAQKYLNFGSGINGFQISVKDIFEVNKIIYNAAIGMQKKIYIKTWIDNYGYMYKDIKIVRAIMYLSMFLIIIIACFNIIYSILIYIKEKSIDIAILKTIGASNYFIYNIFFWYGLLIGIISSIIGIIIGILISLNFTYIVKIIEYILGHPILSGNIYFIDFLPSKLNIKNILFVFFSTIFISIISSIYPSKRANKINPSKILNR